VFRESQQFVQIEGISRHGKFNRRPREKLNFYSPKDEFFKFLL